MDQEKIDENALAIELMRLMELWIWDVRYGSKGDPSVYGFSQEFPNTFKFLKGLQKLKIEKTKERWHAIIEGIKKVEIGEQ